MVPFNIFCGSCFFCSRGLYSNCHNVNPNATAVGAIYGYSHTSAATTAVSRSTSGCPSPTSAPA
jgi:threonine dehydrogenase-like Zn-dependent dehydrogenase